MSIHIRALSPETYAALESLSSERQWADIHEWMEPEAVAWLAYRLELAPDNETTFPKGKWATIQRIQQMVRSYAGQEYAERKP